MNLLNFVTGGTGISSGLTAPAAVSNLALTTPTGTGGELTWTLPSNGGSVILSQRIERSPAGAGTWTVLSDVISASATSFTDTTAAPATAYDYRHRSTNGVGDSLYSNVVTITTVATVPAAVANLALINPTATGGLLTWTLPSNGGSALLSQRIERSPAGANTWSLLDTAISASATSFLDTTATVETEYDYRHRSTNAIGNSAYSNIVTITTVDAPFDFGSIAGLVLNLDAADVSTITQSGGAISAWDDASGNTDAAVGTGSYGTRQINGNLVVAQNGSSDTFNTDDVLNTITNGGNTTFVVFNTNNLGTKQRLITGVNASNGSRWGLQYDANITKTLIGIHDNTGSTTATLPIVPDSFPHIAMLHRNGADMYIAFDGQESATVSANSFTLANVVTSRASTTDWLNGNICQILVYDEALSSGDIATVYSALLAKWITPNLNPQFASSAKPWYTTASGVVEFDGKAVGWRDQVQAPGTDLGATAFSLLPTVTGDDIIFNGSSQALTSVAATDAAAFIKATPLPDASGGDVGEGFTCTGLSRLANGNWVVSNDGRNVEGDATFEPSVVILSPDFTTKVDEFLLTDYITGPESCQGVVVLPDNTIWVAVPSPATLLHIEDDGTEIEQVSLGYTPNGLTYDTNRNELVVQTTSTVRWLTPGTTTITKTETITITDLDQLWFDADYSTEGALWMTAGANNSTGALWIFDIAADVLIDTRFSNSSTPLPGSLAIEGIYFDRALNRLYIINDDYFHGGRSKGNAVREYAYSPPMGREFSLFFQGRVVAANAAETSAIMHWGQGSSALFGFYIPANTTGTLRVIIENEGGAATADFTTDLTVEAVYWADVDIPGQTVTLYKDNVLVDTASLSLSSSAGVGTLNGPTIGAQRTGAATYARYTNMTLKAAGLMRDSSERTAFYNNLIA
jgi:hypothetical protein